MVVVEKKEGLEANSAFYLISYSLRVMIHRRLDVGKAISAQTYSPNARGCNIDDGVDTYKIGPV